MSQWPMRPLSDIATLVGGGTPSRDNSAYWDGDIPWVTPTDLPAPEFGISRMASARDQITQMGLSGSSATLVPEGTVLFSSRASIGKVAVAGMYLTTNQGFVNFVPGPEITSRYLAYSLWHRREDISRLSGSTTFKEVSRGTLQKYLIPVPPLAEQERIVRLLDEADAIRKLRAQADQRTADLIPALFHQMFGDPITNPMGWPVQPLSEVIAGLQGGRNVNPAAEGEPGGLYRVLKVSAVTSGKFSGAESKPVSADYQPPKSHFVRRGDVLFSRANTTELVGATCYVPDEPRDLLLPDKIWRFVWKQESPVNPTFVLHLLQSKPIRKELSKLASGTGGSMKNISQSKLLSLPIPVPPMPLQQEFATRVAEVRCMQEQQVKSSEAVQATFEAILSTSFGRSETDDYSKHFPLDHADQMKAL